MKTQNKYVHQFSKANYKKAGSPTKISLFQVDSRLTNKQIQKKIHNYEHESKPDHTSFYLKGFPDSALVLMDRPPFDIEPDPIKRHMYMELFNKGIEHRRIDLYVGAAIESALFHTTDAKPIYADVTGDQVLSTQDVIQLITAEFIRIISTILQTQRIYLEHNRQYRFETDATGPTNSAVHLANGTTIDWSTIISNCLNAIRSKCEVFTAEEWSLQTAWFPQVARSK